jgi:hypothetical protein
MTEMPNPYRTNDVQGNRALIIIVNSTDVPAYAAFHLGVLPALNHFGFPYRIADLAKMDFGGLSESAGIVIGHDNVGSALSPSLVSAIAEASKGGCGLVSLDGAILKSTPAVQELFGLSELRSGTFQNIVASDVEHYVTGMQIPGRLHEFHLPVTGSYCTRILPGFRSIAGDADGKTVVVAGSTEGSRKVAFLLSPELWLPQYFGHAMGIDDLLWRSIVWVARKPFPVLMMPPFAVCRIDDAIGSHDDFGYIRTLNKHQWISNIGLFLDDIDEKGAAEIRECHRSGAGEFSAHSFHEIGDPLPDQLYIRHDGVEYSLSELQGIFDRLDAFFAKVGIVPSRTANIHYDEIGINALPFLAARGQFFTMDFIPFGVTWAANSYSWLPYPYGHQSMNYCPMSPDPRFWNVMGHCLSSYKTPDAWMSPGEFMFGHTPFAGESPATNIAGAVDTALLSVKVGVSSGFFGTLMCHEQRIQAVTSEEWERIISGIADGLSGWQIIYRGYDEIAQYAKDKARTAISKASFDRATGDLTAEFEGTCDSYLSCYVFHDDEDRCEYELRHITAFSGTTRLEIS